MLRIGGNLGFAAGPAIGGFMAVSLTFAWIFGVAGLSVAVALILIEFPAKLINE
jgi:MFS family permease